MPHKFLLALLMSLACAAASAKEAPLAAADPMLEDRVMNLSEQLRCLVCQNQTLADSHAELAIDLKNQVREKLASGMSDKDVVDYMVQRYGDFVLYKPPVKTTTWLLWFGPFLLLGGGITALLMKLAKRGKAGEENGNAVTEEELRRAAALLGGDNQVKDKA